MTKPKLVAIQESTQECPHEKLRRLSRELAQAIADVEYVTMANIYPAGTVKYPVHLCLDRDYARISYATFRYRDALKALGACKGRGIRKLIAERDLAHRALIEAFDGGEYDFPGHIPGGQGL